MEISRAAKRQSDHMNSYFHRQIQLWGEQKQNLLKNKKIAIIGCGGLGCSLAIALGSSGIGELILVDFDKVELHNIHRQIAFTQDDIGQYKCHALADVITKRSPFVHVKTVSDDFDTFCKESHEVDLIIDATDNLPTRAKIDSFAKKTDTPWIYGSVEEFHGQVCFFHESNFSAFNISDKKPQGIAAPIVMFVASLQANLALRYLVGLEIKKDLLYYLYFDNSGELITQKFSMPK